MFRIGQKVVCVDAESDSGRLWDGLIKEGAVYTIDDICPGVYGNYLSCHLKEVKRIAPVPFRLSRFRPLVDKKTDISVFTEILRRETVDDRAPASVAD